MSEGRPLPLDRPSESITHPLAGRGRAGGPAPKEGAQAVIENVALDVVCRKQSGREQSSTH